MRPLTLTMTLLLLLGLAALSAAPTAAAIDCDNFAEPFHSSCEDDWNPDPIVEHYAGDVLDVARCLYNTAPAQWTTACA